MAITLETIHKDIQQLKGELYILRSMLGDEGKLTDKARQEVEQAREEMAQGKFVSHKEVMAKYG